jgi:phasin family protein
VQRNTTEMVLNMASKATTPATSKPAKPAVPKAVPAKAAPVAAKVEAEKPVPAAAETKQPVAETPAPIMSEKTEALVTKDALVTKIVSVEPTPIAQGVTKMTDTVKATAEKATEYFADIREKAGEVAEKGKKMAADAVEFNKANVEAMIEAGKIAAKGAQDMGKTNVDFAKSNFEEMQVAFKEMTAVKSPTDFVKLQGEYARKSFDVAVAQTSKNTEAMVKLVSDMFQPISNRIAVTTDYFKKAA